MGVLNRQKCTEMLDEFKAYLKSETDMEPLGTDGERLIKTFCEAVATDDLVGKKFDSLLESVEENGTTQDPDSRSDGRNSRGKNGHSGEERRKSAGGFHLYERRKKPYTYAARNKNDKRVQFGRGSSERS